MNTTRLVALIVSLALTLGCAEKFAAPLQLSPAGVVAFHADRVMRGVAALQDITIAGEASGAWSKANADVVVERTRIAGQAGVELAYALKQGTEATTAKQRAINLIRQALGQIPSRLPEAMRQQLLPYITVVLTALALLD